MSTRITVATCNLNQWSLDFSGNLTRILQSCNDAKSQQATYRLGPELEICGYGCEDHFFEVDTFTHCWESLSELFTLGATDGLVCDFGMPILFNGIRYNCRVICKDRRVLLIRPKVSLADNGNYRESRYFTAYRPNEHVDEAIQYLLPKALFEEKFGQRYAAFGTRHLSFSGDGFTLGVESCEELWTPQSSHIDAALLGVDIIGNGSGSHHELRKLNARLELMVAATRKCGGVYLYANQRGCDGGRLYYDGCAMIVCNGEVLAQANQFDMRDVEVVVATVDLEDVRSYRASIPSFGVQAARMWGEKKNPYVVCEGVTLGGGGGEEGGPSPSVGKESVRLHKPEEECLFGPACWLWDYLRRSGASGFFLPLSGGADSSATAAIVGTMCQMVTKTAKSNPHGEVAQECRRVCHKTNDSLSNDLSPWVPSTPQQLANIIFHTCYMGTSNSSELTLSRAKRLAEAIGSYHLSIKIDVMVSAVIQIFTVATNHTPEFESRGGSMTQDLALQNIQARVRMVMAYLFAQLLPWVRGQKGFLLVLSSANVDEGLRGYMTKYDCSSADLNPIGAISKIDLRRMLMYASKHLYRDNDDDNNNVSMDVLEEIAIAPPTAELRPDEGEGEHSQLDEDEMGMTYDELGVFGKLRKLSRCGPVSMFRKLLVTWSHLSPLEVATKVKRFFYFYSVNRHKMCTITPSYHAEGYSPDDNRFDLRQFLYNVKWTRQFQVIDEIVREKTTNENIVKNDDDDDGIKKE